MCEKVHIKPRTFAGIDQNPSLLGFGCMRFPTVVEGKPDIDEPQAQKMIDYAYAHGVTYYDTAYPYHSGLSETFIGKALKRYPRDTFQLASKMPGWLLESVDDAKRIFNEQLSRCQVDYFDYYLAHALGKKQFEAYRIEGVMDFLYQMKSEGKIRHLGFSFHDTPEVLEEIIQSHTWDFVQIQCNYLDWTFQDAKRQYEIVESYGVPCIVMEPVRGGTLATLCEDSSAILKDANPEASIASWAIRYAASLPNVMLVLSGMSNQEQTADNIKTLTAFKPITKAEQETIDRALKVFLANATIPCTACGYCMPCPEGVDIPKLFELYNHYALSKFKPAFLRSYEALEEEKRSISCIACGVCLDHCPQKIDIPKHMAEITALYDRLNSE